MRKFHTTAGRLKNPYFFYDLQRQTEPHTIKSRTFDPTANAPQESMSQRVKKVFGALGSRDESRREAELKGITVAGIKVPSRPEEPTNCCMSGCVNCVWELYKDEIEEWKDTRNKARRVLMEPKYLHVKWPPLLGPEPRTRQASSPHSESPSRAKVRATEEERLEEAELDDDDDINHGISVFIQTEKKIRARKLARQAEAKKSSTASHA